MRLLVDADKVWFEIMTLKESELEPELKAKSKSYYEKMSEDDKVLLRSRAAKLYEEQVEKYRGKKEMTPADRKWLDKVLKEGTQSDKISAMLLQIRECPFYNLEWITKLLSMASSSSRHESFPAIEALRDVFSFVLPPKSSGRVLIPWKSRYLTNDKDITPGSFLVLAYFEDILRQTYIEFLKLLEILLQDQIPNSRERTMRVVFELALAYKCDFTEMLLKLLVNKLGDPQRKISSRVIYYLQCIVEKHEGLTLPIVKSIQDEITRASPLNDKPAFYGLTFFSQLRLNESSPEVTKILLQTYQHFLAMFLEQLRKASQETRKKNGLKRKRKIKGKGEEEGGGEEDDLPRTTKVVLLGLTRAIPFAQSTEESGLLEYASKLLAITGNIRSFPTLLQASSLIFKIFTDGQSPSEASLELLTQLVTERLLCYPRLAESRSIHPQLFKLLYKIFSTLADSPHSQSLPCLRRMVKSLLTVSTTISNPAFPAAALLILSEMISIRPGIRLSISFPEDQETLDSSTGSSYWELLILSKHYHPTVSRYANTLLGPNGEIDIGQEPEDPFVSMTSSASLEDFISGSIGNATSAGNAG